MPLRSRLWNHGPRASTRRRISSFGSIWIAFTVFYLLSGHIMKGAATGPAQGDAGASAPLTALLRRLAEKCNRLAVAVQRADIHIGSAGLDARRFAAAGQIRIDKRADVFVATFAFEP